MSASCSGSIIKGNRPVARATFRDEDGELTDPTTVVVITRDPSGDQTTYTSPHATITNPSTGVWEFTFPSALMEVGEWWAYIRGTVGLIAAAEVKIEVRGLHVSV